ncbi:MAG: hypothetical protein RL572_392 [Pseudomonadota bacterium]
MRLHSWGRYPVTESEPHAPRTPAAIAALLRHRDAAPASLIARGLGRSYGDSALAAEVIQTQALDHLQSFDQTSGELRCAAGLSLDQVLQVFLPRGWMLPVVPGTRFVSVGGAIASDVHGKNHHVAGTFGQHVTRLALLQASGEVVECTPDHNRDLFDATCGGMGLTGIILDASLRLQRVPGSAILQQSLRSANLEEVVAQLEEHAAATYSVAWLDCLARGRTLGRALLYLGEHAQDGRYLAPRPARLSVPFDAPALLLNRFSMSAFNALYYQRRVDPQARQRLEADSFFFPLDGIAHWNRLYGRHGFLQYQCVIPQDAALAGIRRVLQASGAAGKGSFLSVLKKFGPGNRHWLSFPLEGYTLALDFKHEPSLLPLLDELDRIVLDHGGRLYLAKDARMSAETFRRSYPRWEQMRALRLASGADRLFNSLQSQRLGL